MMSHFIPHEDFYYTRLLLFSWMNGSTPTNVSESNGEYLISQIVEISKQTDLVLINCNDISSVDDHFIDPIYKFLKDTKFKIVFFSTNNSSILVKHIDDHIQADELMLSRKVFNDGNINSICFVDEQYCSNELNESLNSALKIEKKWLQKEIKNSYFKFEEPKRLSSTPLLAAGEFNAFSFTSNPFKFRWIAVLLAESINQVIQQDMPKSYTIIAASLRGAAIAGAVWEILHYISKPKLYVIDHIGPQHHILEAPLEDQKINSDYNIYIGDFLIGGTEVKIAAAYCNFLGGKIQHAFLIGKFTNQETIGSETKIHALINLQDCVSGLEYKLN